MKKPILDINALTDLLTENGTATFKGHSNHPGIAGWVTETETLLAKAFDFTWLIWEDRKSIESNIRFRLRLAETKSPKEAEALRAVGRDGMELKNIPVNLRTPVVCTVAVDDNPLALQHVPDTVITKQMCIDAALINGVAARFIPEVFFDQETCDHIVNVDRGAFPHIPTRFKTFEMSVRVVSRSTFMLKDVPDTMKVVVQEVVESQAIKAAQNVLERHGVQ